MCGGLQLGTTSVRLMPPTVSTILHAQTFRRLLVVGSGDSALSAQLASEKDLMLCICILFGIYALHENVFGSIPA